MQLFFSQNIEYENIFFGQEELHHLKVTRKKIGDSIIVVDGKSNAFRARIEKITRSGAEATIISAYKSSLIISQDLKFNCNVFSVYNFSNHLLN